MKRLLIYIIAILSISPWARAADGELFPYPVAPDDMERLDERCDFIITRFWRPCDFKSAMSQYDKLRSTFSDWVGLLPYASVDSVHASIDALLAKVAKSGPQTLAVAQMAEEFAYSDSSEIRSAEIFLPFARAAASHKKIDASHRNHFAKMAQRIENTQVGKPVQHMEIVGTDGRKTTLNDYHTQMIALVFNSHGKNSLERIRLSADIAINTLIDRGLLTLIYIEPGQATPEWTSEASSYPSDWVVGAMPDAREWFELGNDESPTIMLLDGRHRVLAKNLTTDGLMLMLAKVRQQSGV